MHELERTLRCELGVTATAEASGAFGADLERARKSKVGDLMIALERHGGSVAAAIRDRLTDDLPPGTRCDVTLATDDSRPAFDVTIRLTADDAAPALPAGHIAGIREAVAEALTLRATAQGHWRPVVGVTVPGTPAASTGEAARSSVQWARWLAIAIAVAAIAAGVVYALSVGD